MKRTNIVMISKKICLLSVLAMSCMLTGCIEREDKSKTHEGMAYIEAMDYDSALNSFDEAQELKEDMELINRGRGIAYIGKMDYASACEAFENSLAYCYGNVGNLEVDTNYYLATAYYKNGQLKEAIDVYSAILDYKGKEKDAYYLRGTVELENGNYEMAVVDFDKAISLNPGDYGRLIDVYISLDSNGYKEAGQQYLSKAMNEGQDKMSDYDLGRLNYYLGDYNAARNYLEKAKDKGGSDVVLFLGRTYEALGDYNYAASVYESYLAAHEPRQELYNQLALCKMKTSDYEAALTAVQSGLALEGNSALQPLKANEIICYEYLGDFDKAKNLISDYIKLYPDDAKARREVEFLSTR